jgi:Domain of unknown function (DUF6883)
MKLPQAERAFVDLAKLRHYCLNLDHPEGKHKAKAFQSKLGVTAVHAERLRQVILDAILTHEAIEQSPTFYGRRFIVDFTVLTMKGRRDWSLQGYLQILY